MPNELNPVYPGTVGAAGHGDINNKGVSIVAVSTNGTTAVNTALGTTNPFNGAVTGIFLVSKGTSSATVKVSTSEGLIASITKGTSAGAMYGPTSALNNTTINVGSTLGVVTSGAVDHDAYVYITYSVDVE